MPKLPFISAAQEKAKAQAEAVAKTIRAAAEADAEAVLAEAENETQAALARANEMVTQAQSLLAKAESLAAMNEVSAIPTADVAAVDSDTFFYRIITRAIDATNGHPYIVVAFWRSREDALLGRAAAHVNDFRFGKIAWSGIEPETGIRFTAADTLRRIVEDYWRRKLAEERRTGQTAPTGTLSRTPISTVDVYGELALLDSVPAENEV